MALCSHKFDPGLALFYNFGLNRQNSGESSTCAEFGKHLHGVIKSLLTKQIEGVEILDVMYLLLLITI